MKTKEIQDLIDFISQSGLNEVRIKTDELKLSIKREPDVKEVVANNPVQNTPSVPQYVETTPKTPEVRVEEKSHTPPNNNRVQVKSPMIGTFYKSSNPDSPAFVKVGDKVKKGQVLCIIEAMKLFNEIESDYDGTITNILVDNASPVEFDQPLFEVEP